MYGSIATVATGDADVNSVLPLLHHNLCVFEAKGSWEVLIEDSDFANGIISLKFFASLGIIQFNEEVKIWLPLLIIDNWDRNLIFFLLLSHRHSLVYMLVVFGGGS